MSLFESISITPVFLTLKASLIGVLWACVVIAVLIDLYHGIKRSKARGEFTNSFGIKRTVDKASSYLTLMLFMLIGDIVVSIATVSFLPFGIAVIPVFNVVGATVLVWNEWISVREKADQKMLNRINKSSVEIGKVLVEVINIYKNNPGVLDELIQKHEQKKSIENKSA